MVFVWKKLNKHLVKNITRKLRQIVYISHRCCQLLRYSKNLILKNDNLYESFFFFFFLITLFTLLAESQHVSKAVIYVKRKSKNYNKHSRLILWGFPWFSFVLPFTVCLHFFLRYFNDKKTLTEKTIKIKVATFLVQLLV